MRDLATRVWWPLQRRTSTAMRSVRFARQRVVRGWDDRALWSLDDHLAKTLGQQLVRMSEIAHSYPGDDYPYEKWTADLKRHGVALLAYQGAHYETTTMDEWESIYGPAREALTWVAEHLGALWD